MQNNWNDLAIRQQFREDFCMTPDTFINTFTLVKNRLEKQVTQCCEAFLIQKTVVMLINDDAFRGVLWKNGVLRNFIKFTGKHLCQGLFFNKKHRSSSPEVFCRKGILRNFAKVTWKHLCQSLYFNKVAGSGLQLY